VADEDTNSKKMDDVVKPGETPADATSRPVIVKHRSIAKDPMVASPNPSQLSTDENIASTKDEKKEGTPHKAAKIDPLTMSKPANNEEKAPESEDAKETDTAEDDSKQPSLGTAAVDVLADKAVKSKKDNKAEREKQELIAKHIEEKTYFAPIGQISKKKAELRGLLLVSLILTVAGLYVAVDANLLLENIELPFEFIK
jgi:hypothetical protein